MTISNELGWFWNQPLVSTRRFDQYALIVFWRKALLQKTIRAYWARRWVETNSSFQNHPNSLETVITFCYRKPFHIVGELLHFCVCTFKVPLSALLVVLSIDSCTVIMNPEVQHVFPMREPFLHLNQILHCTTKRHSDFRSERRGRSVHLLCIKTH